MDVIREHAKEPVSTLASEPEYEKCIHEIYKTLKLVEYLNWSKISVQVLITHSGFASGIQSILVIEHEFLFDGNEINFKDLFET